MPDEFMDDLIARMENFHSWTDMYFEGLKLIDNNDCAGAIAILRKAEKAAENEKPTSAAQTAERLGFCLHQEGFFEEAESYYRKALAYCAMDPVSPITPEQYEAAGPIRGELDRLQRLGDQAFAKATREVLDKCLENYSRLLTEKGRKKDAADLRQQIIAQQLALMAYE
jgi:tetratricopeptide (TPR) repeat protein